MSGDLGPRVAISAAQKFVARYSDVDVLLVGNQSELLRLFPALSQSSPRITIVPSVSVVAMDDDPLMVLRHKKDSSMWLSLAALRDDQADACVSAGNTGALLVMAKYLIKTFVGIDRPAICKSMPVDKGQTYLLDLGANINCAPEHLHQFALMGAVLASSVNSPGKPTVALLNIGTENSKGTEVLQSSQSLLQADSRLNYVGFIEANAIFSGIAEVIVCDGFHGNIALKASEGTARFIAEKIRRLFNKNMMTKTVAFLLWPLLNPLRAELDPALYNGASFLGLQKTVVKSHGGADQKAFLQALIVAREQVLQQVPQRIQQQFTNP